MGHGPSFTDAYFESVSGLTTTGSTVMVRPRHTDASVLLWRSLMQGFGGIGVIVLGIIMMPFLRVGGMQLFQTESSDKSEKIVAKAFDLASGSSRSTFWPCQPLRRHFIAPLGMTWFDAVNHAMPTIATGGLSTHDSSFAYFGSFDNYSRMIWTDGHSS